MSKTSPLFTLPQSHEKETDNIFDFRAPPPSPIAPSRRDSLVENDDVLSEFLEHSLRVPDLILPDLIFPRQQLLREVPDFDFQGLNLYGHDLVSKIRVSLFEFGCFQVINHGILPELIGTAVRRAGRVFRISPEKKRKAVRSTEMEFGFEDQVSGEQYEDAVSEMGDEFVWGRSNVFQLKMEGIWPNKFSKFSDKMETLAKAIEKIAKDIMLILNEDYPNLPKAEGHNKNVEGCVCHIYKHPHGVAPDQCLSDVIRMMIKGSEYSHALSLHVCDGSSEFHVYSKKGLISFTPLENALIVTAGDQIQAWSGGQYKQVIGKPTYTFKNKDCISLAFLYSPPVVSTITSTEFHHQGKVEKIISLRDQALFAIFFTIACQFSLWFCEKFRL